jgi:8-oxo-dGTP diphosphatase
MKKIYPGIKAIVLKNNKVLVMRRSMEEDHAQGLWDTPGGAIDFAEDHKVCLLREVLEEAGIDIEIIKPLRVWSYFKNPDTQIIGVTMLCRYKSGEVKLSEEHTEFKWIDPEKILNMETTDGIRKDVLTAKDYLN